MSLFDDIRRENHNLAIVLKDYPRLKRIFESSYPDKAHFIYELLQNAEDTRAESVKFTLTEDALVFEHDGQPFIERDVRNITDVGADDKEPDDESIGMFGIGFKSVFAYTETPRIWSPTFSFQITEWVLPTEIEGVPDLGKRTRFEFPFNSAKKPQAIALQEIRTGLEELSELSLLFLTHINSISWILIDGSETDVLRIRHSDHHYELLKQTGNHKINSLHFLRFSEAVTEKVERRKPDTIYRVAAAFPLKSRTEAQDYDGAKSLAEQFAISGDKHGIVAVYLPAKKETSGLRFHINAPFIPEISRASIVDAPANQALIEQIAALIANQALTKIRDLGLLTTDFLSVLPIPEDSIPESYQTIRQRIRDAMISERLTPSFDGAHAPGRDLVRGSRPLKDLLTDDDLSFLLDRHQTPLKWAKSASQNNSRADRFLSDVITEELTHERFIQIIVDKTNRSCDTEFMKWLGAKPLAWHQQFYALLNRIQDDSRVSSHGLSSCAIIRLKDGTYEAGSRCHFPVREMEDDVQLRIVDSGVYRSGNNEDQQQRACRFLENVGVREVDEVEKIKALLKSDYTQSRNEVEIDWKKYRKDLKRFIALFEKTGNAQLFGDYYVLQREGGEWVKPSEIYLDSPYQDTRLRSFYDALREEKRIRAKLSDAYLNLGIHREELVAFASACGAGERLEIRRCDGSLKGNEKLERLRSSTPGNHTRFEDYEDFFIEELEDAILSRSIEVSRLVWQTLSECDFDWWEARYRKNRDRGYVSGLHSLLADLLMENEWIPQSDGTFVRPSDALREKLPPGFHIDTGWEWLGKIGFESNRRESENTERTVDEEDMAKKAGFESAKAMSEGQWFVGLPPEERERIRKKYDRMDIDRRPNQQSSNPDRRAYRVHEEGLQALQRKYEHRSRSVLVDQDGTKKQAEEYLRHQYTGGDGKMNCQVCQGELPFKLPSGEYYFEKVRFLDELVRNHRENYLALCPLHAAMYMHARTSPKSMLEALEELSGRELKVTLADNEETIYFTTNHINDIRAKVKSEEDTSGRCDNVDGDSSE